MNKFYNFGIFIISIIALIFTYVVNLNETFGIFPKLDFLADEAELKTNVYSVVAVLLFLINFRRSYKRWTGLKIVNQLGKYLFNTVISKDRKKAVVLNNSIEIAGYFIFGIAFLILSNDATLVSFVFLLSILDTLLFSFYGLKGKKFRVGITNKAIVMADREISPIYFTDLKRIIKQNQILYFEYTNDMVSDFNLNTISSTNQNDFIETLRSVIDEKKVYFSGFIEN